MRKPRRSSPRARAAEADEIDGPDLAAADAAESVLVAADWTGPPRSVATVMRPEVLREAARLFFVAAAAACAAAALLAWHGPRALTGGAPIALAWAVLALGAAAAVAMPERMRGLAMNALLALGSLVIAVAAWLGAGPAAPGLGAFGVLVCVACATSGVRVGIGLAAWQVALLLALHLGAWPAGRLVPDDAVLRLGAHLLSVAVGLAAGAVVARVLSRYLRLASEREQRFRSLLSLAADAYWEIDDRHRVVAGIYQRGPAGAVGPDRELGRVPWEHPRFGCEPDVLDRLQADLEARVPFRDVPVRWNAADGRTRHFVVSGEPRFDPRGLFLGYWGVARDVTEDAAARAALASTETRYRELFTRIPTPLVLHRNGRVLDANPAATALFGFTDAERIVGFDLLSTYEGGDSRERARRRMEQLSGQPAGTALPVTDFRLVVGGRRISVRATGVTVDAQGGQALLSIFIDDTVRLAAEQKVRRSEALLSHLVATSPDLISLTDLESGRYVMVNHEFERVSGWSRDEAIGRTSVELGVWHSPDERDEFITRLRETGQVANLSTRFRSKDGRGFLLLVSAARFTMDGRDYVVINARDITENERSRLEREAILAGASVGIAVTRAQRFVLANPHFEQVLRWPPGRLVGQSGRVVWESDEVYAEIGARVGPRLSRGEPVELEHTMRRHDGTTMLGLLRAHAIDPSRPADGGTVWILEDITERRAAERALALARDEAEAANRAKSAFLANTSHELRTPLNAMIGLAHLARGAELDEAVRERYLAQVEDSAQALSAIISDILDLSKIEAGKLQLERTAFDLGALLEATRAGYATLASARGLVLEARIDPGARGGALGDPLRLRQVLGNFLGNAIKFTEHGQVWLRVVREDDDVRLEIEDTGPGIDAATQARLFKPFVQADQSTTRRYGGSGLGLSICRELALLMGGEVGVRSEPGRGSCFWARLPLPRAELPEPPPLPVPAQTLSGARVLMVEDNPVNMMIAVAMLENWGVEVTQAGDGAQACQAVDRAVAQDRPFDLGRLAVQMPEMRGPEAARALRAAGHRLPIIALTAAALVTEREEALAAGMDDFLTKPIDAERLRTTLLRWRAARTATA
ncbi:MAG: PAS domain S-box protein [Pseudomonadota bacterium]